MQVAISLEGTRSCGDGSGDILGTASGFGFIKGVGDGHFLGVQVEQRELPISVFLVLPSAVLAPPHMFSTDRIHRGD